MGKFKRGRSAKKNLQIQHNEPDHLVNAPHSFVIHRGLSGGYTLELTKDFRKVMEPFTASSLKENKKNSIKDFVSIAGIFHISHLCIFSRTSLGLYFKLARIPRGPTLTFKVHNFCLARDVISSLKKQLVYNEAYKNSPLIILNNFSGEGMHMKLMASMFQNMFPSINLASINLSNLRRCVLLNYNSTSKLIDFRHYIIKAIPVGVSKVVKKVVLGKVPNLSHCDDISELIEKSAVLSESEAEDDPNSQVTLPQKLSSRGNLKAEKSAIKLSEIGPRITMQLIKVEDGLLDGEVLFHELVTKSEEEVKTIKKKREEKIKLKMYRRKVQEDNKKKKEMIKKEHKEKSLKGIRKTDAVESYEIVPEGTQQEAIAKLGEDDDDDDVEYYRQEVGAEPDQDLFSGTSRKRSHPATEFKNYKKVKFNTSEHKKPNMSKQKKEQKFTRSGNAQRQHNNNKIGTWGSPKGPRGTHKGPRGAQKNPRDVKKGPRGVKNGPRGAQKGKQKVHKKQSKGFKHKHK